MSPDEKQLTEDQLMLASQVVCGYCHHRFTTQEDWQIHFMFVHDKQPTPKDLMEMLETILITVSRDEKPKPSE